MKRSKFQYRVATIKGVRRRHIMNDIQQDGGNSICGEALIPEYDEGEKDKSGIFDWDGVAKIKSCEDCKDLILWISDHRRSHINDH